MLAGGGVGVGATPRRARSPIERVMLGALMYFPSIASRVGGVT